MQTLLKIRSTIYNAEKLHTHIYTVDTYRCVHLDHTYRQKAKEKSKVSSSS